MAGGTARSRHVQFFNPMPGLALAFRFRGVSYVRRFDLVNSINSPKSTERRGIMIQQLVFIFKVLVNTIGFISLSVNAALNRATLSLASVQYL